MVTASINSRLDRIENELKKIRSEVASKESLEKLAGAWSDYETKEGESLEEMKKEIYEKREGKSRRFNR
ncbi:MAG: hypothetical protein ABEJ95_07265 [Candidatus Nanohalobium sp.]